MKKVLIMGGSYFIGRTLVDHMLGEGYDVFTVNRGSRPVWDVRIQNLVCDREDKERLKQILRPHRFDYVVDVSGLKPKFYARLYRQKAPKSSFFSVPAQYMT